ncbi:hypothetical protein B0H17DRAFT_342775 [Mycena rosella]|uniref:Uncharacterized protein n=1 Tax=Mycena rosella TaxID=1033263 RepID=A0AAD7CR81_MYCRO|nr:hypothetical protein B0H17DRAFT_342775 [Mycena rosella]
MHIRRCVLQSSVWLCARAPCLSAPAASEVRNILRRPAPAAYLGASSGNAPRLPRSSRPNSVFAAFFSAATKPHIGRQQGRRRFDRGQNARVPFLLPQLAHLELLAPEPAITDRLVALLAHSPHVIPELSSITLTRVCPSTPWYQHLVTALSLRREKIDSVRIVWINGRVNRPAHQTWAALRQLVSDGMRIHIGTKKLNYVPG